MGARVASALPVNPVAAGFAAATGGTLPEMGTEPEPAVKVEAVALNTRLPKPLHRALRQLAFDEESTINALLIEGAEMVLAARKTQG